MVNLCLVGTIFSNAASLAVVSIGNFVFPVWSGYEITGLGTVGHIERGVMEVSRDGLRTRYTTKFGCSAFTVRVPIEEREGVVVVDKPYLDHILTNELPKVLMQAGIEPVRGGFRIFAIDAGSVFEKVGLQNEDVIESINGVALDNAAKAIQLLNSLSKEEKIQLVIVRQGEIKTITLIIR